MNNESSEIPEIIFVDLYLQGEFERSLVDVGSSLFDHQ